MDPDLPPPPPSAATPPPPPPAAEQQQLDEPPPAAEPHLDEHVLAGLDAILQEPTRNVVNKFTRLSMMASSTDAAIPARRRASIRSTSSRPTCARSERTIGCPSCART